MTMTLITISLPTKTLFFVIIILLDLNDTLTLIFSNNATNIKLILIDGICSTSIKARVLPDVSFRRIFHLPKIGCPEIIEINFFFSIPHT